jgi:hypothetical protein
MNLLSLSQKNHLTDRLENWQIKIGKKLIVSRKFCIFAPVIIKNCTKTEKQ